MQNENETKSKDKIQIHYKTNSYNQKKKIGNTKLESKIQCKQIRK
jgi:hypothetical protein